MVAEQAYLLTGDVPVETQGGVVQLQQILQATEKGVKYEQGGLRAWR